MYVDDILLTGNSLPFITALIAQMHSVFSMKELGNVSYYVGISLHPFEQGSFLSQQKYATEILVKAGMILYPFLNHLIIEAWLVLYSI